jgi:hypothetical protein
MSGSAVLGGTFGFSRASAAAQDDPAPERLGFSIVQGGATAAVAAGVGGLAWKNRDILASAVWGKTARGTVKGIGENTIKSMGSVFQAKGFSEVLNLAHPLMWTSFGAAAGGLIGSKLSDDPTKGAIEGAAIGGVTALAARGVRQAWNGVPGPNLGKILANKGSAEMSLLAGKARVEMPLGSRWLPKAALLVGGVVAAATLTRAFTHEDSYAAEDHAVSDGSGGYETEPGVRRRMASMNATGDVVFGLHSRRH